MTRVIYKIFLIIIIMVNFGKVHSQTNQITENPMRTSLFWVGGGFGISGFSKLNVSAQLEASYGYNKNLFSIHYLIYQQEHYLGSSKIEYSEFTAYILSYGRNVMNNYCLGSLSFGLGISNDIVNDDTIGFSKNVVKKYENMPSVQIEPQIIFIPAKYVGIGLKLFFIVNKYDVKGNYLVTFKLGKLR